VLTERFDRIEGFDLAGYCQTCLESFDTRRHQDQETLRLSPNALKRLPHMMEPAITQAARRTAAERDPDGWIRVTIPIESIDQAIPELRSSEPTPRSSPPRNCANGSPKPSTR
jgi:hypothetical protein